jgi:hypothetical protein
MLFLLQFDSIKTTNNPFNMQSIFKLLHHVANTMNKIHFFHNESDSQLLGEK